MRKKMSRGQFNETVRDWAKSREPEMAKLVDGNKALIERMKNKMCSGVQVNNPQGHTVHKTAPNAERWNPNYAEKP